MKTTMILRILILFTILTATASGVYAQRKSSKKEEAAKQTPESAAQKDQVNKDQKLGEYANTRNHHNEIQDAATRKRMKKNLKKAERHSWGKNIPWYKRWFRRKKF